MVLKDYMAISGQQGLYKFIAQGRNAVIVEHLETKKRMSAFGTSKVISLDDISLFAQPDDVPLSKVFDSIYDRENGGQCPDEKSDIGVLRKYFEEVVPGYDRERVYDSDIRKVFRWYNMLHQLNLLVKEEPAKEEVKEEKKEEDIKKEKPEEVKKEKVSKPVKTGSPAAEKASNKTGRKKGI